MTAVVTIHRHIEEQQHLHPEATGELTALLNDFVPAAKMIAREVRKAGLIDILGANGTTNTHGETVQKLDQYSQEKIVEAMSYGGHLCCMASEESEGLIPIPAQYRKGKYALSFDPLDGSKNIDVNISIGTIFSIHKKASAGSDGTLEDLLQRGTKQVAAGYVMYGSSTMLVYSTGNGVYGFTLDPSCGEFLLSHKDIRMPAKGSTYSINEGNARKWDEGTRRYVEHLKDEDKTSGRPYGHRYVGTLVADFHRTLINGGIFMYPASPKPKLRLLYECAPMAYLAEQAGGAATTGTERILDIQPTELHQKAPLVIGSRDDVARYEEFFQGKR